MPTSPQSASTTLPGSTGEQDRTQQPGDLVYQVMTIAAILLLLGSLWAF